VADRPLELRHRELDVYAFAQRVHYFLCAGSTWSVFLRAEQPSCGGGGGRSLIELPGSRQDERQVEMHITDHIHEVRRHGNLCSVPCETLRFVKLAADSQYLRPYAESQHPRTGVVGRTCFLADDRCEHSLLEVALPEERFGKEPSGRREQPMLTHRL